MTPAQMFDLKGRVALVTGGSRGIGYAMATALAGAGAKVVLAARNAAETKAAAEKIGGDAEAFDVTDEKAAIAALDRIVEKHGRLDILISNAGSAIRKPLLEYPTSDFDAILGSHLRAGFVLGREAARRMVPNKWGRILYTTSLMARSVRPQQAAYASAKTGLEGLVRAMAIELAPMGVLVNGIAPGFFVTDLTKGLHQTDAFRAQVEARAPIGRWGMPEELAGPALLLCSPAGSYVTGTVLIVDGGTSVAF
ncbi:MAG: SDR family oxidoreductase [Proteobacteria bacterium]|nr:SDR family oxidoreductase [Pseudomonadota bacterium]